MVEIAVSAVCNDRSSLERKIHLACLLQFFLNVLKILNLFTYSIGFLILEKCNDRNKNRDRVNGSILYPFIVR